MAYKMSFVVVLMLAVGACDRQGPAEHNPPNTNVDNLAERKTYKIPEFERAFYKFAPIDNANKAEYFLLSSKEGISELSNWLHQNEDQINEGLNEPQIAVVLTSWFYLELSSGEIESLPIPGGRIAEADKGKPKFRRGPLVPILAEGEYDSLVKIFKDLGEKVEKEAFPRSVR